MHEVGLVLHNTGEQIIEHAIVGVELPSNLAFAIKSPAVISHLYAAGLSFFLRAVYQSSPPLHYFCL